MTTEIQKPPHDGPKQNKKKSRKRHKFLSTAKKFGQKGNFGKGFEVEADTYQYFLRVLDLFQKNAFNSEEDKEIFIENSFTQTEGMEVDLSSNQTLSRILEMLLPYATEEIMLRFTSAFTPKLRTICPDPYASHVLEKLLSVCISKYAAHPKLMEWFHSTCQFVLNNYEEFVFNTYANRVIRRALNCLSGAPEKRTDFHKVDLEAAKKLTDSIKIASKIQKKSTKILVDFARIFIAWPQFKDLFHEELTCGLIQTLLSSLKPYDDELCQIGVKNALDAIDAPINPEDKISAYTLETCISVADEKNFKVIVDKYFQHDIISFAVHPTGNFTVKALLEYVPTGEILDSIFEAFSPQFTQLSKIEKGVLMAALSDACRRLKSNQADFIKKLKEAWEYKDGNLLLFFSKLGQKVIEKEIAPQEEGDVPVKVSFSMEIYGSMVVQNLLQFHKPAMIVNSLFELNGVELTKMCCDPKGSRIIEAFFRSETVGTKMKEKFVVTMLPYMPTLGMEKFGVRVLEAMWVWSNLKLKQRIASSLCDKLTQLSSNRYGKFVVSNYGLHSFKRGPDVWAKAIEMSKKKMEALNEIAQLVGLPTSTPDSELSKSAKKKKKKSEVTPENNEIEMKEEVEYLENTPEKKKKKKTKKSVSNEDIEEIKMECNGENDVDTPKKKKKKSKKGVNSDDVVESFDMQPMEVEETIETPKKKKKRKSEVLTETPIPVKSEEKKNKKKRKREEMESSYVQEDDDGVKSDVKSKKKKLKLDKSFTDDSQVVLDTPIKKKKKKSMKSE